MYAGMHVSMYVCVHVCMLGCWVVMLGRRVFFNPKLWSVHAPMMSSSLDSAHFTLEILDEMDHTHTNTYPLTS
jgi:hypothetical protein